MTPNARLESVLNMLDRAYSGPLCSQEEWDFDRVSTVTHECLAAHGLLRTCDRENPVNTDDELADRFWKAGVELAQRMGLYCVDTERIIQLSAEEIADAIDRQPAELELGLGADKVVRRARQPEDGQRPMMTAIIGTPAAEDIYVDLTAAIAAIPEVDSISGCTLVTAHGRPVVGSTPYETAAGYLEAQFKNQAIERAGRPGMCLTATETSPTAFGVLSGLGPPGGFVPERDVVAVFGIAELKCSFDQFHGAIHAAHCRAALRAGQPSMVGGYGGGPEAAAVLNIALIILQWAVLGAMYGGGNAVDVRYQGNCGSAGMWAHGMINQAASRNSNFMMDALAFQVAGPNTEMLLLESAVGNLVSAVSGASGTMLPYSSGGTKVDYLTPLETKFCAEVMLAGAGMTRHQVNDIVKALIPRYEDRLFSPPVGQSIRECYDLSTMEPKEDWLALYTKVKQELAGIGVEFAEGGDA